MKANITTEVERAAALDLRDWAKIEGPCITVYLAEHNAGAGTTPQKTRLPGLISEATEACARRGIAAATREKLLEPLRQRLEEADRSSHDPAAVLVSSESRFESAQLPWNTEDRVAVEQRPLLIPVAQGISANRSFLILALSRKNTRLLECGPGYQHLVDWPPDTPNGLEEFNNSDHPKQDSGHTPAGVSFGVDSLAERRPRQLHDLWKAIDRDLHALFTAKALPLLLVGTTSEIAAYREVNRYQMLVDNVIEGSPDDGATAPTLAARARAALEGWRSPDLAQALEHYERAGVAKRSEEMEEILRAAVDGRVMHLFLSGGWDETGDITRIGHGEHPPRSFRDHLANAAAVETWRHDGQVWILDRPIQEAAASAVFRW